MRFLFVDQVSDRTETQVVGRRLFAADDPMQYRPLRGDPVVAPGAVSEAIGQLVSWLCLENNKFTARPVFLFADQINVRGMAPVGAVVELMAEIHEMDAESFRFSGAARVKGEVVQTIKDCSGYFMPLGELEDPEQTRERFKALTGGGLTYDGLSGDPYAFASLAGSTMELEKDVSIRTEKCFDPGEKFYADHFPRFPVTPIVMLNEMIGAATSRMVNADGRRRLLPRQIKGIKIRSFVKPGERVEVAVRRAPAEAEGGLVATHAEIHKDGRPILRGSYTYEIKE